MPSNRYILVQKPMIRVCYALLPIVIGAVYLFGWRCLFLIGVVFLFGIAGEALFTFRKRKPVTSAVFVTCLIFSLSLPPTVPFWMAIVGILAGVIFGKMAFGGFGQNVFNPAMVGRCFIYIAFPEALTNNWVEPAWNGLGGFTFWTASIDAVTMATPLAMVESSAPPAIYDLIIGNVSGSMGETSLLLILMGGIYILIKKAASWRLALSCLLGGVIMSAILHFSGISTAVVVLHELLAGSFMFGCVFVVTEPVSGAKTPGGQWVYGMATGALTMVLRAYSNFSEGFMFSVLLMNAFVPLIDFLMGKWVNKRKTVQ